MKRLSEIEIETNWAYHKNPQYPNYCWDEGRKRVDYTLMVYQKALELALENEAEEYIVEAEKLING